jgi:hypothetical protein
MKRRLLIVLAAVLLLLLPLGLSHIAGQVEEQSVAESLEVVRRSLDRAVVECYALEGFYPPNLSYLKEHYGISIDETVYYVDYFYLGSNLMPDITVLPVPKGGDGHG